MIKQPMPEPRLEACPACGSKDVALKPVAGPAYELKQIRCPRCEIGGPAMYLGEYAIMRWNCMVSKLNEHKLEHTHET